MRLLKRFSRRLWASPFYCKTKAASIVELKWFFSTMRRIPISTSASNDSFSDRHFFHRTGSTSTLSRSYPVLLTRLQSARRIGSFVRPRLPSRWKLATTLSIAIAIAGSCACLCGPGGAGLIDYTQSTDTCMRCYMFVLPFCNLCMQSPRLVRLGQYLAFTVPTSKAPITHGFR
jgi:hypothetical protein